MATPRTKLRWKPAAARTDWCDLDSGVFTITDDRGYPHSVYISVTRDGSVWVRAGQDHKREWIYTNEHEKRLRTTILDQNTVSMLEHLNYTDYCVLTDLDLKVQTEAGWHPSFLAVFDPSKKSNQIWSFRPIRDCRVKTNLTLSRDKQSIVCDGGIKHTCGLRKLPQKGQQSSVMFLKEVTLDPQGQDRWLCNPKKDTNSYSFRGSYYYAFAKLASCPPLEDSRLLGHVAKLRAERDTMEGAVIIPDPTQTALSHGVVRSWRVFIKIISPYHEVYLQIWRPKANGEDKTYTLAAQTFYHPTELRFQEIPLFSKDYKSIRKGDVLGITFPKENPIGWSSVPCAYEEQRYLFVTKKNTLTVGDTLTFQQAPSGDQACRHYSLTAVFVNKTDAKSVEDWLCPSRRPLRGSRRLQNGRSYNQNSDRDSNADNGVTDESSDYKTSGSLFGSDLAVPVHLVLIIIGCLVLLLLIVGAVSYYKAVKI